MPVAADEQFAEYLRAAAEGLNLDDEMRVRLRTPLREITFELPLRRDDGRLAMVRAWRVHHSDAAGPTYGPLRCHPDVDAPLMRGIAAWQSVQCALFGLPFGGAMGGIAIDADRASPGERQRVCRSYAARLKRLFGDHTDIVAPDLGTDGRSMGWIADELARRGSPTPAAVTGKPIAIGGSLGRKTATGRGLVLVLEEVLGLAGDALVGKRLLVHGFGNVGRAVVEAVHAHGALVTGVADVHAGVVDADGLDVPALLEHVRTHDTVAGFRAKDRVDADAVIHAEGDVFVAASLAGIVDAKAVAQTHFETVVEAAPFALTVEGEAALIARGVRIVPAVLAAAGGVVVSYCEWVQNLHRFYWDADKVDAELERIVIGGLDRATTKASEEDLSLREACYRLGLARVEEAERLRGWV